MKNEVMVRFPASCGEFVQGYSPQESYVCSYAINCYSYAQINVKHIQSFDSDESESIEVTHPKVCQALSIFLKEHQLTLEKFLTQATVHIESEIPVGKGMGSSTADLVATLWAVALFLEIDLSQTDLMRYCVAVEPTDSIVFSDMTLANPNTGKIFAQVSDFFAEDILCLEPKETLTTKAYRQLIADKVTVSQYEDYERLKVDFQQVMMNKDMASLSRLTADSARFNQAFVKTPYLDELLSLTELSGVKGLNIAHSGTVVGIWFESNQISAEVLSQYVSQIDTNHYYQKHLCYRCITSQAECLINH